MKYRRMLTAVIFAAVLSLTACTQPTELLPLRGQSGASGGHVQSAPAPTSHFNL
ncbi:hypothetical protein J5226_21215 [Lysobacter sp. K5869]|uniref:hypothetical protein n=1 Tax=Lysobacter sp. K5869 TaxID=2820808 RepID=UPI001C0635AE|nr:hypothetical protein [Lysobacter sp. K5869]QWP76087.1 hypothetical protein J5226_21215 [Lysobacter sp. K5869]